MSNVQPFTARRAAVAGSFYPATAALLQSNIDALMAHARQSQDTRAFRHNPPALIVPHAGYQYSGAVAAAGYACLPQPEHIRRVLLLGPAHRVGFTGVATPACQSFNTPLGEVAIDSEAIARLQLRQLVADHRQAHELEHSLEVQLPFLQQVLGEFAMLPLLVGDAPPSQVAQIIDEVLEDYRQQGFGQDQCLVVVSSDLSHYHSYESAIHRDLQTSSAICHHDHNLTGEQACGCRAINGLMLSDLGNGLDVHCIAMQNSGDSGGDPQRVVGYGAFALADRSERPQPLSRQERQQLLRIARQALANHFDPQLTIDLQNLSPALERRRNCFVTLTRRQRLRGCMGGLTAQQPLYQDVIEHAYAAAYRDHRFALLTEEELAEVVIEISVLSPEEPMMFSSERDLIRQLQPGLDGLTLRAGRHHQATFLPSVWASMPSAEAFVLHLKQKAGLAAGAWPEGIQAWRYSSEHFSEADFEGWNDM